MGWDFGWKTRRELVEYLTDSKATVKFAVVNESGTSVLWAVKNYGNGNFIGCYLMEKSTHGHGYKEMCESMHPYYYSCPLEFLDMAEESSAEWRAGVKKFHEEKAARAKFFKLIAVGSTVTLRDTYKPNSFKVTSVKPLRGSANGVVYSIPKKGIVAVA